MPHLLQGAQDVEGVLLVVAGHGLKQAHSGTWQVVADRRLVSIRRSHPGTHCPDELSDTIKGRHLLLAQDQPQKRVHGRPHDAAQQVEPSYPTQGQQSQQKDRAIGRQAIQRVAPFNRPTSPKSRQHTLKQTKAIERRQRDQVKTKQMSTVLFVTIFTLFIIFRERVTGIAVQLADMIELYGRSEAVLPSFKDFSHIIEEDKVENPVPYSEITTSFHQIVFNNITFKYPGTEDYVLQNKSLVLNTNNNNIIGITGSSGNGKSTIMKIALKLYPLTEGEIKIDDVDIQSMDPQYIRKHITYINQNSRLFDKTIIDNIMYGCKDDDVCKEHFDNIMKYPRIVELFKELDIDKDTVGYSGEKISGGQRQIVNLISGLVNPSKILVLDEPTNALDSELKKEVIDIIKYFKQHKQCIIIITHDQDVHSTFDEHIKI